MRLSVILVGLCMYLLAGLEARIRVMYCTFMYVLDDGI